MNKVIFDYAVALLSRREPTIYDTLKKHLKRDPRKCTILEVKFPNYRLACVSLALQRCLRDGQRNGRMLGVSVTNTSAELIELFNPYDYYQQTIGPVQYIDIAVSHDESVDCPERALFLLRHAGHRVGAYLNKAPSDDVIGVNVVARDRAAAHKFAQHLRQLTDKASIYKGKVIALKQESRWSSGTRVEFCSVVKVGRDKLILSPRVLDEIDRNTIRFDRHRETLLKQGRHLKRGLLLYGPPGTGKSLTIMHLISTMAGRTTILLTGSTMDLLADACNLARELEPATIVIDDVDLIAEERSTQRANRVLFELLNAMDGINDDADLLFLLTTNKPEVLEPALVARPGRIDQAILIPLPDRECRIRLFELYSKGLTVELSESESDALLDKTDGASAAFIRELFRKAALFAAEDAADGTICRASTDAHAGAVRDSHFKAGLDLLHTADGLTGKFLGFGDGVRVVPQEA